MLCVYVIVGLSFGLFGVVPRGGIEPPLPRREDQTEAASGLAGSEHFVDAPVRLSCKFYGVN